MAVFSDGKIFTTVASGAREVYSTLFLKSSVSITGGSGSQDDQFTLTV